MMELNGIALDEGGETYLADINLRLPSGEFNVLLGPTLAGKTSLMRVVAGLSRPSAGKVLLNGKDITALPVRKRRAAMVYQQFINYPTMTVFDNIASPLAAAGVSRADIRRRVAECAELLGLQKLLSRRPAELSGGQQQRTALARALVKDADIILLDEPLANLDYKLREALREELPRLFAGRSAVVLYATSDPAEALLLGGQTVIMHQGGVAQCGAAAKVFRQPDNLSAAEIFSDPPLNTLTARKKSGDIVISGRKFPAPPELDGRADGDYTMAFRAHHLLLERPQTPHIAVSGSVQIAEIAGSETFVHVRAAGHDWVAQTPRSGGWETDDAVELYIDPRRMMAFAKDGKRVTGGGDGVN